jgi:site-specific DNA-cytosine methylase
MNVLSCFDGISCGRIALERAGVQIDNYYSSEIDKYAIQVSKKNYPHIIQLGDITAWETWDLPFINLLIGGSPCQGFSIAGAGLNFDDPRSKLFFTFVDILNHYRKINPKLLFLLENVKMKKEWRDIISSYLEVEPIEINSTLVSAQNRERLYWTNIPGITQPIDKHIILSNIIETGISDREKSYCIDANYFKGGNPKSYFDKGRRQLIFENEPIILHNVYGGFKERKPRVFIEKAPTIRTAAGGGHIPSVVTRSEVFYRKLTPIECERLQTLPDNYTEGISNTQRYKCLGNGWTVDVISHLFSFIDTVSK